MRRVAWCSKRPPWWATTLCSVAVLAWSAGGCASSPGPPPLSGPGRSPDCRNHPGCVSPQQLQVAYGIAPLLAKGIDGRGQTVVIVDPAASAQAAGTSDITQDLVQYDRRFDLPAATLEVVPSPSGPGLSALATQEEVLDVETVHAVAPGAAIRVVLYPNPQTGTAAAAIALYIGSLRYAIEQDLGGVLSLSEIVGEDCFSVAQADQLHAVFQAARDRHITVVAGSGDLGAANKPCGELIGNSNSLPPLKGVGLPAADPLVSSVGGTTLKLDPATGSYQHETAWNTPAVPATSAPSSASGGGFSQLFPRPGYQNGVSGTAAQRGIPDVAADANPASGLALVTQRKGSVRIGAGGGTSAAAPLWAGLAALADQTAGRPLGFLNPALYRIAAGPDYHQAFHDISTGNNTMTFGATTVTGYQATPGWDPVTGWGSPNAQILVPLLLRHVHPDDGQGF